MRWLPLVLLASCVDGNVISATWKANTPDPDGHDPGTCSHALFTGEEVSVRIESGGELLADDVFDCDDQRFEIAIPYEITEATVTVKDGWSYDWIREVTDIDSNVYLGEIYFRYY